jgi:hypothetical protein
MKTTDLIDKVRFQNIEFSTQDMTLLDQQSKILSVAKKDVQKITLKYGFQSERPFVQVGFGVALLLIGLYFIVNFILQALINRIIYTDMLLSILLFPVGVWFMVDGFRRRLYFEVSLDQDKRKFPLGKNPDKGELQRFIKIASRLGYPIDATILDKNLIT